MATQSPCEQVAAVVRTWDQCGADAKDFDPKMPKHPEFVYRKSGHWQGWAHFLGVAETAESTDPRHPGGPGLGAVLEGAPIKGWELPPRDH